MIFNLDLNKQVQQVIFSRKTKTPSSVSGTAGLTLDIKLNFLTHMKNTTQKISKIMSLLTRFKPILLRSTLLTT